MDVFFLNFKTTTNKCNANNLKCTDRKAFNELNVNFKVYHVSFVSYFDINFVFEYSRKLQQKYRHVIPVYR